MKFREIDYGKPTKLDKWIEYKRSYDEILEECVRGISCGVFIGCPSAHTLHTHIYYHYLNKILECVCVYNSIFNEGE